MATKLKDDLHGGDQKEVPYNYRGDSNGYDDQTSPLGDSSDPRGYSPQTTPSGDASDPRQSGAAGDASDPRGDNLQNSRGSGDFDRSALQDKESMAAGATGTAAAQKEAAMVGVGADGSSMYREEPARTGFAGKFTGRMKKRAKRQAATLAIVGVLGGGGVFGSAVLQGPLQFVHLAQKLQNFHFASNQSTSNHMLMNALLYAKGKGERSRMGLAGNRVADIWEKKLVAETGLKPVYQEGTRRFAGYQVVDRQKAERVLLNASNLDTRNSRRLEASMGNGTRFGPASEVRGGVVTNDSNGRLDPNTEILNMSETSIADRAAANKTIFKAMNMNNIASALGAHTLKHRFGVKYSPFNKVKEKFDSKVAERLDKEYRESIANGSQASPGLGNEDRLDTDGDGTADAPDGADADASTQTKSYVDDFMKSGAFKTTTNAAIVVGVMCMAKQFGNNVEDYKFTNNIVPMTRMGFSSISGGNQVMAGDTDMARLQYMTKYLYDKEKQTSWTQAESIRAEEGKQGGVKMPDEADLGKNGEKPRLFKLIDGIPLLGTTCGVVEGFMNLPIIKEVNTAVAGVTTAGLDAALSVGGTNSEQLMQSALKAASGKSVDPASKGADYGNLANTGAFLAANDEAVSMGGKDLTQEERVRVAELTRYEQKQENASKSTIARYFDPYDSESMVSSLIDNSPSSPEQAMAMMSSPLKTLSSTFSNTLSFLTPKAKAASLYDYGPAKVGFSPEELRYEEYEDPYALAMSVTADGTKLEDDLPRLNDKYGKKCFGVTITIDDTGAHYSTLGQSEMKEVYANRKKDDCKAEKNTNDRFNQYRSLIGSVKALVAANCSLADDETACKELGVGTGPAESSGDSNEGDSNSGLASGDSKELAKKILDSGKVSIDAKYLQQMKDVASGSGNCNLNPTILQLIATIAEKHSITISSLNRMCTRTLTASGTGSYHYRDGGGHAVDISVIDGKATNGGDENARKVLQEILPNLPKGSGIGQSNCRSSPLRLPNGVIEFGDSCNHLHIQVPVKKM